MADNARSFTRPDNEIILANAGGMGGVSLAAVTVAAIVKSTDVANAKVILALGNGGSNATFLVESNEGVGWFDGTNARHSSAGRLVSGAWMLLAFTKAAGTVTGRFHIYDYSSPGWVHENSTDGTSINTGTLTSNTAWIGQDNGSSGVGWEGQIQAVGAWTSELSDAAVEALEPGRYAWLDASPTAFWTLNQAATTDDVLDEIGSADESGLTGTSVTTGNPDWSDSADPPAESGGQDPNALHVVAAPRF